MRMMYRIALSVYVLFFVSFTYTYASYKHIAVLSFYEITPKSDVLSLHHFEKLMAFLQHKNIHVVSLQDAVDHIQNGGVFEKIPVALTFASGLRSVYDYAFPVLKKYDYPFTFFLPLASLESYPSKYLQKFEVKELLSQGADIASGSTGFSQLIEKDDLAIYQDLKKSKDTLEDLFQKKVSFINYPQGKTSSTIMLLAQKAGYKAAFGQYSGFLTKNHNLYYSPRFIVKNDTIKNIKKRIFYRPLDGEVTYPNNPLLFNSFTNKITLEFSDSFLIENPNSLNCYLSTAKEFSFQFKHGAQNTILYQIELPSSGFKQGSNRINCTAKDDENQYYWFSYQWSLKK